MFNVHILLYQDGLSWEERAQILNQYLVAGISLAVIVSSMLIYRQVKRDKAKKALQKKRSITKSSKIPEKFSIHFGSSPQSIETLLNQKGCKNLVVTHEKKGNQEFITIVFNNQLSALLEFEFIRSSTIRIHRFAFVENSKFNYSSHLLKALSKKYCFQKKTGIECYLSKTDKNSCIKLQEYGFKEVAIPKPEKQLSPEAMKMKVYSNELNL